MITEQKANRLINSTSPYLLQHAYNPVDWYEWGPEALARAKEEDKAIIVSIGYSSCHWCHVMERECFEKVEVAELMNQHYICIKVDREERPDIDHLYMDAVHALGIQGGWPLNVFLTPDQKPFFGGTYFSQDTWMQVLNNIHNAFQLQRERIESTAEELRQHLMRSELTSYIKSSPGSNLKEELQYIYQKLDGKFDKTWGGIDKAPKFIMPSVWLWLMRYFHASQDDNALLQLTLTLKRIARGGIYDQLGGGFSRYSVDGYWFAPHFEKMLYDNAQLLSLYSEAFAITKDEEFKTVVYETFDWLQREMTSDEGGFYSALDADSEGEEGKFYVWTKKEIEHNLHDEAEVFCAYYGVEEEGNWEHGNNILTRPKTDEAFALEKNISKELLLEEIKNAKKTLLRERNTRITPGLDDKIITSWNAMTIVGLVDAYKAFNDQRFYKAAALNMRFLENEVMRSTTLYRSYKNKTGTVYGFLDDYAFVIQAQLKLYEVTFEDYWIRRAESFMNHVIENFFDENDGFFFYSSAESEKLLTRKKEIFDNVIPASNSVMAWNLYRLGSILEREDWKGIATEMTRNLSHLIKEEPYYMSQWAIVFSEIRKGLIEVSFVGEGAEILREEYHLDYRPFTLAMGTKSKSTLPLLVDKEGAPNNTKIYVCLNRTCLAPVNTVAEAAALLAQFDS